MTLLPILLPQGSAIKVSVNDKISQGQIIAEKAAKSPEQIIHVAKELSVAPGKSGQYLKKNLGDGIKIEEVLAVKKGALGLGSKKLISKFWGTITKIDSESGDLYIRLQNQDKVESVISPVEGVVDFCDNSKIVLKTDKEAYIAQDALGGTAQGESVCLKDFDPGKLTSFVSEKIVIVRFLDKISFFKLIGLDAKGIITESIDQLDFVDLSEKKIQIPVMNVSEEDFNKLIKINGQTLFLNGENKSIIVL